MRFRRNDVRGWVGTLCIHLLLALVLFLWKVNITATEQEFIEVSWGSVSNIRSSTMPHAGMAGSEGASLASVKPDHQIADLPERKFNGPDDVLPVSRATKMDIEEKPARHLAQVASTTRGQKDRGAGAGLGGKEKATMPGTGDFAGDVADPQASGLTGHDVGSSVSVSVQWTDGGTRKKISGDLPEYPRGVSVETQIKLETVVMPDGSVKSAKPVQKGNTRLEEAAMTSVRLWKFEQLRKSSPQKDQLCIITFNFLLR